MSAVYYYGQDGEKVDVSIKKMFDLDEKELRWSTDLHTSVYDFVGFVFKDNNILVIFPKHYYSEADIAFLNRDHVESAHDIELLYRVIKKYSDKANVSPRAKSYIGAQDGYDSDYPFNPFFEIYDYYQRYGLYKEKEEKVVRGSSGKISWKKTIEKAQKIVSEENLIFAPLYVKKKNLSSVFITDCMAFIIDYTIETFHNFLSLNNTGYHRDRFDYLNNIDFVISQLIQYRNRVFKDIHKHLITNMVDFFNQYKLRTKAEGGKTHVSIKYFDKIWQDMIGQYLNRHFVGVDGTGHGVVFDEQQMVSTVLFEDKSYTDIDDSNHHFHIDIDHIAHVGDTLYIFDSKYYFELKHLNYKQYSYNELLRYYYPGVTNIYNALLLPGAAGSELHFSLNARYAGARFMGNNIMEQYLEPKRVMEDYVSNLIAL